MTNKMTNGLAAYSVHGDASSTVNINLNFDLRGTSNEQFQARLEKLRDVVGFLGELIQGRKNGGVEYGRMYGITSQVVGRNEIKQIT